MRSNIFIRRIQKQQAPDRVKVYVNDSDEEETNKYQTWFLISLQSSKVLLSWRLLIGLIFWFDMFHSPLIMVWPGFR